MKTINGYTKEEILAAIEHMKRSAKITRESALTQLTKQDQAWYEKRAEQMLTRVVELETMLKELENGPK